MFPPQHDDDTTESAVFQEMEDQLDKYLAAQGSASVLRDAEMPTFPWPDTDNVMVEYLILRACELAAEVPAADLIIWLTTHTWFEATIAENARLTTQ